MCREGTALLTVLRIYTSKWSQADTKLPMAERPQKATRMACSSDTSGVSWMLCANLGTAWLLLTWSLATTLDHLSNLSFSYCHWPCCRICVALLPVCWDSMLLSRTETKEADLRKRVFSHTRSPIAKSVWAVGNNMIYISTLRWSFLFHQHHLSHTHYHPPRPCMFKYFKVLAVVVSFTSVLKWWLCFQKFPLNYKVLSNSYLN